jgi:hypothetical protein
MRFIDDVGKAIEPAVNSQVAIRNRNLGNAAQLSVSAPNTAKSASKRYSHRTMAAV